MQIRYCVYELRTEKRLSLRQLEALSGVSKSHINAIENGSCHPSVYTLCLLARALEVEISLLFTVE